MYNKSDALLGFDPVEKRATWELQAWATSDFCNPQCVSRESTQDLSQPAKLDSYAVPKWCGIKQRSWAYFGKENG